MRPYGYKKLKNPPGDGCFLCLRVLSCFSKRTKTAHRSDEKLKIKKELKKREIDDISKEVEFDETHGRTQNQDRE